MPVFHRECESLERMYRNVVHDQHKPQAFTTKAVGCDTVELRSLTTFCLLFRCRSLCLRASVTSPHGTSRYGEANSSYRIRPRSAESNAGHDVRTRRQAPHPSPNSIYQSHLTSNDLVEGSTRFGRRSIRTAMGPVSVQVGPLLSMTLRCSLIAFSTNVEGSWCSVVCPVRSAQWDDGVLQQQPGKRRQSLRREPAGSAARRWAWSTSGLRSEEPSAVRQP